MNKVKTILVAALALVLAASCNKAEIDSNKEITVSYSVSVPATKALGEGEAVNKVWYAVYRTDGALVSAYQTVDFTSGSANCPVVMMRGQSYKVLRPCPRGAVGLPTEGRESDCAPLPPCLWLPLQDKCQAPARHPRHSAAQGIYANMNTTNKNKLLYKTVLVIKNRFDI